MGQICFQVNLDLTLVYSQFPLSPSPKKTKEIENQPGGGGLGEKQTQVLHVCNTNGRSLVELYSL